MQTALRIMAVIFIYWGVTSLFSSPAEFENKLDTYKPVIGHILHWEVVYIESDNKRIDGMSSHRPTVSYIVDGQQYTVKSSIAFPGNPDQMTGVTTVYYNPTNPQEAEVQQYFDQKKDNKEIDDLFSMPKAFILAMIGIGLFLFSNSQTFKEHKVELSKR
ncbi:DUF3592 domain-containing protein [Candidatus Uabimicrobium amorphum]|uniref:DUF3592 domain-containing protein n=1 Tax=Uabimicrobium amorphum TaxID=2596890 RepID=A0A5S9F3F6_UABAM|nr:DUF3592 domain-containing protein [Candidatus Uabimicrobium amorphum]BBM84636.1 hypothetical protein UABAM_02997 [Candidatus Uabimicrobium amorphum]